MDCIENIMFVFAAPFLISTAFEVERSRFLVDKELYSDAPFLVSSSV